jgi:hypothetical protein
VVLRPRCQALSDLLFDCQLEFVGGEVLPEGMSCWVAIQCAEIAPMVGLLARESTAPDDGSESAGAAMFARWMDWACLYNSESERNEVVSVGMWCGNGTPEVVEAAEGQAL